MSMFLRGPTAQIREVKELLDKQGFRTLTGPLAEAGSWGTKAWLAVASQDVARAKAVHDQHLEDLVAKDGLPVHDNTADFDAEETACPACSTVFPTKGTTRCPDCGLNFGGAR